MTDTLVKDLIERAGRLAAGRSLWEQHWQDLADLMLPRRADFTTAHVPGDRRTQRQFDSVPMQAARGLAAAIDAMLKPKGERWFHIKAAEEDLNERDEVAAWLQDAERRLAAALYNPKARFLQATAEVDLDLVVFGTGVLFVSENTTLSRLLFRAIHLKHAYIALDGDGAADTVFLRMLLTARQAERRWGRGRLGERVREALEGGKDPDRKFPFLQAVFPRGTLDLRRRDSGNMPWESVTIDVESEHRIGTGGFHEFPFIVPRWDTAADEDYGRSPGMLALPDANTLMQQGKTLLEAGHKAVDPPLIGVGDGAISAARTFPGGISYADSDAWQATRGRPPLVPLNTGFNLPIGRDMQNDTRQQVFAAFFRSVLQLPIEGPQMTATEVVERKEEFMRVIGPVFGRLEADYTGPIVERAFGILMRGGAFRPPPPALRGRGIRFEYQSPVEKARRQIEAAASTRTAEVLAPYVGFDPAIMDNFDGDRIARDVAAGLGMPQKWIRPAQQVARARAARAQAERAAQQVADAQTALAGAEQAADIASKVPPELVEAAARDPAAADAALAQALGIFGGATEEEPDTGGDPAAQAAVPPPLQG